MMNKIEIKVDEFYNLYNFPCTIQNVLQKGYVDIYLTLVARGLKSDASILLDFEFLSNSLTGEVKIKYWIKW